MVLPVSEASAAICYLERFASDEANLWGSFSFLPVRDTWYALPRGALAGGVARGLGHLSANSGRAASSLASPCVLMPCRFQMHPVAICSPQRLALDEANLSGSFSFLPARDTWFASPMGAPAGCLAGGLGRLSANCSSASSDGAGSLVCLCVGQIALPSPVLLALGGSPLLLLAEVVLHLPGRK